MRISPLTLCSRVSVPQQAAATHLGVHLQGLLITEGVQSVYIYVRYCRGEKTPILGNVAMLHC